MGATGSVGGLAPGAALAEPVMPREKPVDLAEQVRRRRAALIARKGRGEFFKLTPTPSAPALGAGGGKTKLGG